MKKIIKNNNKAFTLIELLAVIIILALLMAIAIPMVSKYIEQSRKKAHITTASAFVDGLTREIVSNNVPLMMDSDTVYYIPFDCIPIEKGGTSPHGTWEFAYVLMTYDYGNRNYYIYSKDSKGMGIEGVEVEKIKASDVKNILGIKDDLIEISGKTKSSIVPDSCDFGNQIVESSGFTPDDSCFNISSVGKLTSNFPGSYEGAIFSPDKTHPCYTQELIIPNTVNGIEVSSIGYSAFNRHELKAVTIPDSVTSIGDYAFSNNQLSNVTIPDSVTSIGIGAFRNNQLTSLTLPNSLTSIREGVFYNNQLSNVTIPNSVTSIEASAFRHNQLSNVTIPDSVTSIGDYAFHNNQLSSVNIPNSVTSIGGAAFESNQLSNVTIPDSVTSIGPSAFYQNPLGPITMQGRESTTGMTLGYNWNGTGTIVFEP